MRVLTLCNRRALAVLVGLLPALAGAHGLLLDANSDGESIFGTAYYSNGEKAVNESVSLLSLSVAEATPEHAITDAEGNFAFTAINSHRYRVAVYGDEGHVVEVDLVATPNPKPQLIDRDAAQASSLWPPPAWAILGGMMLLSLIPVMVSRRAIAKT